MKKEAVDLIVNNAPELKEYRRALEEIEAGKFCWHRTWGVGEIVSYDELNNRVIINFDRGGCGHAMDPVFYVKKIQLLDNDSILVKAKKDPPFVDALCRENPVELVVQILQIMPGQSANLAELQSMASYVLRDVLSETQFKKWWYQTQKLLDKDPRIAPPKKKADAYVLRAEPVLPEQAILEEFYLTRLPLKKISLGEKLYQLADRVESIREDLPQILEELTKVIRENKQLSVAQKLHGCWVRNDLARYLHEDVEALLPTSSSFIRDNESLSRLAETLPPQYYKRFFALVMRTYSDEAEWRHIYFQLLKGSSGKLTSECINFLIECQQTNELMEVLGKWLGEQHLREPLLSWIVKNRKVNRYATLIRPLLTPQLLKAIFQAIDWEALSLQPGRRISLIDTLVGDKDLIGDILKNATVEAANDLAQSLLMNQGFNVLAKRSILARFIRVFPSLQGLVDGNVDRYEEPLWVSASSLDTLRREYETLVNKKIPENTLAISTARAFGDLSENSEYKMARQDQEMLLSRKTQMEKDLALARVFNPSETSPNCVGIGSVVEVEDQNHRRSTVVVLGAWDGDPQRGIISYKTPLGQILLGKKVNDIYSPPSSSASTFTIKNILPWHER
jgi:transcription elongation GreA/GreB family factor